MPDRSGVRNLGAAVFGTFVLAAVFVFAVPLADMAWVVMLRWRMGKPFYLGDTNHLSHRLVRRGLTPACAVLLIWLLAALCGWLAMQLWDHSVLATRTSIENGRGGHDAILALEARQVDIAVVTPAEFADMAYRGAGLYEGNPRPWLRALGRQAAPPLRG